VRLSLFNETANYSHHTARHECECRHNHNSVKVGGRVCDANPRFACPSQILEGEQQQAAYWQSGKLLARLFQLKTRDSDEALVVMMEFYVGEASGADIVHEVTLRGKRMMPLLLKYRDSSVTFPDKKYPSFLLSRKDVKIEDFDNAISSIKAGSIYGKE
jgi:hypothetical protein